MRRTVTAAKDLGLEHLTLYSFSTENWKRPAGEVRDLMRLLRLFVRSDLANLKQNGVRVRIIGDRETLESDTVGLLRKAEDETAGESALNLNIAFNYGGRDEILRAARKLAEAAKAGRLEPDAIGESELSAQLDTNFAPDPDFIIRTSGEQRISNFLLWQTAYSEFVFMDVLWPDFGADHLRAAIDEFTQRDRRYSGRAQTAAG